MTHSAHNGSNVGTGFLKLQHSLLATCSMTSSSVMSGYGCSANVLTSQSVIPNDLKHIDWNQLKLSIKHKGIDMHQKLKFLRVQKTIE